MIERRFHEDEKNLSDAVSVNSNPYELAFLQHNLGVGYYERICGSRANNLEKSIELYTNALTIFTRKAYPNKWANTTNNLANAYRDRIHGSASDNIDKAIQLYEAALLVCTRKEYPAAWAETTNNLANAYQTRIHGSASENIVCVCVVYVCM